MFLESIVNVVIVPVPGTAFILIINNDPQRGEGCCSINIRGTEIESGYLLFKWMLACNEGVIIVHIGGRLIQIESMCGSEGSENGHYEIKSMV